MYRKKFKKLEPYDSRRQPSWLVHPQKSNENPEVIVDYKRLLYERCLVLATELVHRSVVVEVKASEIIWGSMYCKLNNDSVSTKCFIRHVWCRKHIAISSFHELQRRQVMAGYHDLEW